MINTDILSRTVSKLSQIIVQIMDEKRSLLTPPPLGNLGATYTVHLRLIRKYVLDFLFVLVELFSLGVTAETLRANTDWKSAFSEGVVEFRQNFHVSKWEKFQPQLDF